jgi:hypothetical protein
VILLHSGVVAVLVALPVFAAFPSHGQERPAPPPQVRDLARTTFQNFVCTQLINFFARNQSLQASELVLPRDRFDGNDQKVVFSNLIHNNVCGEIVYHYPAACEWRNADNGRTCHLQGSMLSEPEKTEARVTMAYFKVYGGDGPTGGYFAKFDSLAREISPYFLPMQGYEKLPADAPDRVESLFKAFQGDIDAQYRTDPPAYGSVRPGVRVIPEAMPPAEALKSYPSAWAAYARFIAWLHTGSAPN